MNLHTAFTAAVLAFSAVAAQAAPQATVKLERVVVTGKATQIAQLPRVVVTGYAQREVAQLPRVVVTGYSESTLARQTLAAAKSTVKRG
jgi:outer membrane receptor protein involved in Fe transport